MSEMNDDLQQRIKAMMALKPEVGTIVVMQRTFRDALAEVAKDGCCTVVLDWYLRGAGDNDEQSAVEPTPCGHCIVCVSREVVKG